MLENLEEIRIQPSLDFEFVTVEFANGADGRPLRKIVWIKKQNGKLQWNKKELSIDELAEVKRLAKKDGKWVGWKSDSRRAEDNRTAHAIRNWQVTESEDGSMVNTNLPAPRGTWFSDQDENRNF